MAFGIKRWQKQELTRQCHAEDQENSFNARCRKRRSVRSVTNSRGRKSPLNVRRPRGQFCCQDDLQREPGSDSKRVLLCRFELGGCPFPSPPQLCDGEIRGHGAQTRGFSCSAVFGVFARIHVASLSVTITCHVPCACPSYMPNV